GNDRSALHRARSRRRGRRGAAVPAQRPARGGASGRRAPRVRDERRAASAAARLPAPPARTGLVRHDQRQVARADRAPRPAVRGLPAVLVVPPTAGRGGAGRALAADAAALPARPTGHPRVPDPRPDGLGGRVPARGTRLVGPRADRARRGERRRRRDVGRGRARPAREPLGLAGLALPLGRAARRARAGFTRARRGRQRAAPRADLEPGRLLEQRRADGARRRHLSTSVKTTATNATTTAVITTSPPYVERRKTPSSFPCLAPTIAGVGAAGIPQPGGLSAANWSVISSRRERKRYSAAGRPPTRPGSRRSPVRSRTPRRRRTRCRFVAETSCPSAAT